MIAVPLRTRLSVNGVDLPIRSSRWLHRQQKQCLHHLPAWEDLEVALPTLLTRCLQALLPPPPMVQTIRPLTCAPASTPMVMVGGASTYANPCLCHTGVSSHSFVLDGSRWLSVRGTVPFSSGRGRVAPVAGPAAVTEQCRATSPCPRQPARHISCE